MLAGTRSGGECARTNSWLWRDDWRKRRMTVHCSAVLPKMVNLIKIAEGPSTSVSSVAFSPDGKRIASGQYATRRCGCGTPTPASRSASR